MFADEIPIKITPGSWPVTDKKIETWRPYFHPFRELLCFGRDWGPIQVEDPDGRSTIFLISPRSVSPTPGEIVDRLNERRASKSLAKGRPPIRAVQEIPESTLRTVRAAEDGRRFEETQRRRVIFVSGRDLSAEGDKQE